MKLAEWRGKIISAVEDLNKNDDALSRRLSDLVDSFNNYCIETQGRLTKLESNYKYLKNLKNENIKYRRWLWGLIISIVGEAIALFGIIIHLL